MRRTTGWSAIVGHRQNNTITKMAKNEIQINAQELETNQNN
jgi:hypothetical protein